MWKRIVVLAVFAAAGIVAWQLELHERLDPGRLQAWLTGSGIWGPLVFLGLFSLAGLGVPAFPFLLAAVAVWPAGTALLLNWAGGLCAAMVGFSFARYLGRDWVQAHLPARFAGLNARVANRGLVTVIFVRLMFYLAAPAHWALGLTRVGFGTFVLGSLVGMLPWAIVWTLLGGSAFKWLRGQPPSVWVGIAAGVSAIALLWRLRSRQREMGDVS